MELTMVFSLRKMCSRMKVFIQLILLNVVSVSVSVDAVQYQDAAVMAHVIGSGAMNTEHYFHNLGVACENRTPGLWRIIQEGRNKCKNSREDRQLYYESLPKGSFEKNCRKWRQSGICNKNFAKDLDHCLTSRQGSAALAFMDAFMDFACRNVFDTENQLARHLETHPPYNAPGVFQCFPELQDRILNCVKKDKFSSTQCSQFLTVKQCFAEFYSSYRDCNKVGVVGFLRDLFRSMTFSLGCPEHQMSWDKFGVGSSQSFNLPQQIVASTPYPYRPYPNIYDDLRPVNYEENDTSLIPPLTRILPRPISPVVSKSKTSHPILHSVPFLLPVPKNQKHDTGCRNDTSVILGNIWPHSFQTAFNNGPTWAWGYERYGDPRGYPYDRFYSFRKEPRHEEDVAVDKSVYDVYQVHNNRYGLPPPLPRQLSSRRKAKNLVLLRSTTEASRYWDDLDNHLRKYKDDHQFQEEVTTPRIPTPILLKYLTTNADQFSRRRTTQKYPRTTQIIPDYSEEDQGTQIKQIPSLIPKPRIPNPNIIRTTPKPRAIITRKRIKDGQTLLIVERDVNQNQNRGHQNPDEDDIILVSTTESVGPRPPSRTTARVRNRVSPFPHPPHQFSTTDLASFTLRPYRRKIGRSDATVSSSPNSLLIFNPPSEAHYNGANELEINEISTTSSIKPKVFTIRPRLRPKQNGTLLPYIRQSSTSRSFPIIDHPYDSDLSNANTRSSQIPKIVRRVKVRKRIQPSTEESSTEYPYFT